MACKGIKKQAITMNKPYVKTMQESMEKQERRISEQLLFGVDSKIPANDILQNNLSQFEWVVRNKAYPNFWGRYLNGEKCLTREEIKFIHSKGCKIAALYTSFDKKETEEQGKLLAKKVSIAAIELHIPQKTAIYLEIASNEIAERDFMRGYAQELIEEGFIPAFKANTDAKFSFDRQFSRGMQTDRAIFQQCLLWAAAPVLAEYDGIITTHFIHPDYWKPFAPSGVTRKEIAVWQYGRNCHPIYDNNDQEATFHINLIRNEKILIKQMF